MRNRINRTAYRGQSRFSGWRAQACAVALSMACLTFAQTVGAQQTRSKSIVGPATMTNSAMATERYRIGPGDILEIRLYKLPELSREALRVEESGTIRMPLINEEIQAACRTESELAKDIADRYLTFMRNPQVDVFIKEYNSKPVAVIGAVNAPGRFQLQRRIRLLDLLSFAGGPAERAGGNIQVVRSINYPTCESPQAGLARNNSEASSIGIYKLRDTLAGNTRSNPYVRPGDVITVLEFEQIYVIGNVVRPSSIPLKEKITLSQAVAMAGGTLPDSQSDRVRIIRKKQDGYTTEEIIVDLRAITKHRAADVVLQPNDIVEVPTASGKRFLRNLFENAVPSFARFPVRVIR